MHIAIASHRLKPGKKAEFLRWYESLAPLVTEIPGIVTQYVVETDEADTVMSIAVYESEAAARGTPGPELQEAMKAFPTYVTEDGIGPRKVHPILAQLT